MIFSHKNCSVPEEGAEQNISRRSEAAARCAITFMAPSKTFNIAGVVSSYVIIQNPALAGKFFKYLESNETDYPPIFSAEATRAAYGGWQEVACGNA